MRWQDSAVDVMLDTMIELVDQGRQTSNSKIQACDLTDVTSALRAAVYPQETAHVRWKWSELRGIWRDWNGQPEPVMARLLNIIEKTATSLEETETYFERSKSVAVTAHLRQKFSEVLKVAGMRLPRPDEYTLLYKCITVWPLADLEHEAEKLQRHSVILLMIY